MWDRIIIVLIAAKGKTECFFWEATRVFSSHFNLVWVLLYSGRRKPIDERIWALVPQLTRQLTCDPLHRLPVGFQLPRRVRSVPPVRNWKPLPRRNGRSRSTGCWVYCTPRKSWSPGGPLGFLGPPPWGLCWAGNSNPKVKWRTLQQLSFHTLISLWRNWLTVITWISDRWQSIVALWKENELFIHLNLSTISIVEFLSPATSRTRTPEGSILKGFIQLTVDTHITSETAFTTTSPTGLA